jgi:hypothetical protein
MHPTEDPSARQRRIAKLQTLMLGAMFTAAAIVGVTVGIGTEHVGWAFAAVIGFRFLLFIFGTVIVVLLGGARHFFGAGGILRR